MPCYAPLRGYLSQKRTSLGKRSVVFNVQEGLEDRPVDVPCGQCIGCRVEYSRQWAMRCIHEASLHDENCFITLTYSPECLPENGSLVKSDFQKFMKRLRKEFYGRDIRYYQCGEYGDRTGRPHYHSLLFGCDFSDKRYFTSRGSHRCYTSGTLEKLWPLGLSEIGDVTFASAAYVASYVVKKYKGKKEDVEKYYGSLVPPYSTMSRRPGIGKAWYDKFKDEVIRNDSCIVNGREVRIPRFYDKFLEEEFPQRFAGIKGKRKRAICYEESSDVRLDKKKQVAVGRMELYSNRSV